jgi:NTE family protein
MENTTGLVLGGGGVTGVAWELGVLKGLRDNGVDLTTAHTVIGTSAGSVVGAQITSVVDLDDLFAEQTKPAHSEIGADFGAGTMLKLVALMMIPASGRGRRARIGRAARRAHPGPATERPARHRVASAHARRRPAGLARPRPADHGCRRRERLVPGLRQDR